MNIRQFIIIKKYFFSGILFVMSSVIVFGYISGSAHDFSSLGWNSTNKICIVCHTPHNSDLSVSDAPLWNHEVTTSSYTVYSSPTMDVPVNQPQGVSLLCLSCHDGSIALDSFGGNTGATNISGVALIGTDLSNDHPISIEWQHQTNDFGSAGWCSNCHNMSSTPPFISELKFFNRYIECATCHDVHNSTGIEKLLRVTKAGSEICLTCHNK